MNYSTFIRENIDSCLVSIAISQTSFSHIDTNLHDTKQIETKDSSSTIIPSVIEEKTDDYDYDYDYSDEGEDDHTIYENGKNFSCNENDDNSLSISEISDSIENISELLMMHWPLHINHDHIHIAYKRNYNTKLKITNQQLIDYINKQNELYSGNYWIIFYQYSYTIDPIV